MANVEGSGIKEIHECPFKVHNTPIVPVCSKSDRTCVGEENCPDMQTYRAVMELLRIIEEIAEKVGVIKI